MPAPLEYAEMSADRQKKSCQECENRCETTPLCIAHLVSSLKVGGMEQFALRVAAEQTSCGHRVSVLALCGGPLEEQARAAGIDVVTLDGCDRPARLLRTIAFFRQLRPDIVNSHNPSSLPYAILAKCVRRTARVILIRHGQGNKPINRFQWQFTDALVAVSASAAEAAAQQNPANKKKIHAIVNGVQTPVATSTRAAMRETLKLTDCVGVIVGRIDALKGHETLIRAVALLRQDRRTPMTVLVVGDGAERGNMEGLASQLGLRSDVIRFLGFRSDIANLLLAADFFVLPSLTEGMPLSILEAMAQQLPIVATPVGGIPEVVTDGEHGLIVPTKDTAALAEAMGRLTDNPALRMRLGEAGYRRVRSEFSFDAMICKYNELYLHLLGSRD